MKKKLAKKKVSPRAKLLAKGKKKVIQKVIAKPLEEEFFRIMVEQRRTDSQGKVIDYFFKEYSPNMGVPSETVDIWVFNLKSMGQGGQLILLDGSPEGKVIETWPSLTRALEIAEIENKALH